MLHLGGNKNPCTSTKQQENKKLFTSDNYKHHHVIFGSHSKTNGPFDFQHGHNLRHNSHKCTQLCTHGILHAKRHCGGPSDKHHHLVRSCNMSNAPSFLHIHN
eukprot:TRINITY_DN57344_c0_g1_i1.p4 TRINITY_DN57344_c0_g1~~TRINITY_DN57344_c0_g1_i1.p4  ORF type:complete len:103 (+),score=10.60 TRINITY_DN57344_c0_g1_i1:109-417(+)